MDNDNIIFSSEVSGYSHLYLINVKTGIKKSLTQGSYEVQHVFLSIDKKDLFLVTNQTEPGSHTIVKLNIASGKNEIITNLGTGLEDICFSKDFKYVAFLSSSTNIPWELYIQEARTNGKLTRITDKSRSEEFSKYPWRILEIVKVTARDGKEIYSRLYKPKVQDPLKPAVIFVHGAGYLQNAHKWWSYYFREYMFHNMLADLGYTVLDMDYRASAGYGRDVRTDIYRFMGGKDLTDQVDGAKYLVANCGVDAARINF
ncbi:MAG: DPP IV N-terminal domain-containing protein [Saprospiraceae bacterium]|nr:DPP IV N-terminal domain-containing protein [Candidatus Brachybacter algidus]MBK8749999.1 DPP IV N-terminal domain-containing protein [Candidatus Brachybacter algidus]